MARWMVDSAVNAPANIAAGAAALWDDAGQALAELTQQPQAPAPQQPPQQPAATAGWDGGWQRMLQRRGQLP